MISGGKRKPWYGDTSFWVAAIDIRGRPLSLIIAQPDNSFGLPRTLPPDGATDPASKDAKLPYQANTKLDEISDWLTKILVGAGLTQIATLPEHVQVLARYFAPGLGGTPSSEPFATGTLVYFAVCGFLVVYLWSRLYMAGALALADRATVLALSERMEDVNTQIDELKRQAQLDAEALSMLQQQLNPLPDGKPVDPQVLDRAIAVATPRVKRDAFYQAYDMRRINWEDGATKEKMERAIPVFVALAKCDTTNEFHLNHGQLGFALKDQRDPDWKGAESELTRAIQIRDRQRDSGWRLYEVVRAECRIHLDPKFARGEPADPGTRTTIVDDLRTALSVDIDWIWTVPAVTQWLDLNPEAADKVKVPLSAAARRRRR
jgi:hypothetical protein